MSEHISRKELKQDKIKETIEHGAEAVISHGQFTLIVVLVALFVALSYGGWKFYIERQTVDASAAFDVAMKAYQGRIASAPDPSDPNALFFADEAARAHALIQLAKTNESLRHPCENGPGAGGEIDSPVEHSKPINWLIRSVRCGANKWASPCDSP